MTATIATRLRRWPLPLSSVLALLLLLAPAIVLRLLPPRQAGLLGRVPVAAELLQSFPLRAGGSPPPLWTQRFGAEQAEAVRGRAGGPRIWWQFWPASGDGAPVLAIPAAWWPRQATPYPPNSRLEGGVLLVAADALQLQQLAEQLNTGGDLPESPADAACRQRLERGAAVLWRSGALDGIAGAQAALLQPIREGCLELAFEGSRLDWRGAGASRATSLAAAAATGPGGPAGTGSASEPLPAGVLLQLRGERMGWLLSDLLGRRAIRTPLQERYGLTPDDLQQLEAAPFLLVIEARGSGSFKALLRLSVVLDATARAAWEVRLEELIPRLEAQGLRRPEPGPDNGDADNDDVVWLDAEGNTVASWGWRDGGLVLHLGEDPLPRELEAVMPSPLAEAPGDGNSDMLTIRARPDQLLSRGLLPRSLPAAIRLADAFQGRVGTASGPSAAPRYGLAGWLAVPSPEDAPPAAAPGPEGSSPEEPSPDEDS
jgi:hypothetical protein